MPVVNAGAKERCRLPPRAPRAGEGCAERPDAGGRGAHQRALRPTRSRAPAPDPPHVREVCGVRRVCGCVRLGTVRPPENPPAGCGCSGRALGGAATRPGFLFLRPHLRPPRARRVALRIRPARIAAKPSRGSRSRRVAPAELTSLLSAAQAPRQICSAASGGSPAARAIARHSSHPPGAPCVMVWQPLPATRRRRCCCRCSAAAPASSRSSARRCRLCRSPPPRTAGRPPRRSRGSRSPETRG